MRARVVSTLALSTISLAIACSSNGGSAVDGAVASNGGAGGANGTGGSVGGSNAQGGQSGSGGEVPSQGGQGGSAPSQGGSTASGGAGIATGGNATPGTGGSSGSTTPPASCTDTAPPNQTPTCADWVSWGTCGQDWFKSYCNASCKRCTGGGTGGAGGSGGSSGGAGGASVTPIQGGTPGWATRYWDCCKPACGWKGNVPSSSTPISSCTAQNASMGSSGYDAASACQGGPAHMCSGFGPWAVSGTLAYGFAAVSKSDYCGRCYQLQFTGNSHNANNDPGSQSLAGKTIIVQAINNGGVGSDQFDLLIPGGGVGDFNACSSQWGVAAADLGETYGGFFLACQKQNGFAYAASKSCAAQKCTSVFGAKGLTALETACKWFTDWYGAADNPALVYKEVPCPSAITSKSGLMR